jgi:hypothetical protein
MGALIVAGAFPENVDRIAWLVVDGVCAVMIARSGVANVFWNGAVTGFILGASATLVQGLFVDTYVANNPWVMETFANQPEGFSMRAFVLQLVPFIGLAGALVLGFLSWLARRMIQSKKEP